MIRTTIDEDGNKVRSAIDYEPSNAYNEFIDGVVYQITYNPDTGEILSKEKVKHHTPQYKLYFNLTPELSLLLGADAIGLLKKLSLSIKENNLITQTYTKANTYDGFMMYQPLTNDKLKKASAKLRKLGIIYKLGKKLHIKASVAWKGDYTLRDIVSQSELILGL